MSLNEQSRILHLRSSDDKIITAELRSLINSSRYLKTRIESLGYDKEEVQPEEIKIDNICGTTLERIVMFCDRHKDDHPSLPERHRKQPEKHRIPRWDREFLRTLSRSDLFDLVTAAHSLQMDVLINFACKTVADMAKGKSTEELRTLFGIPEIWEQPSTSTYSWD